MFPVASGVSFALASVGVVGAFPMARRRELFAEMQPLVTTFEGHPWNWARPEGVVGTPREAEVSRSQETLQASDPTAEASTRQPLDGLS